ncbi:MAG TPA: hypothetical protein VGD94_12095 [Vicinamibacterales bacterium]
MDKSDYQYAIFSDTDFSERAQQYAFAHDVYLLPLRKANYLRPVVTSLRALTPADFGAIDPNNIGLDLGEMRRTIREALRSHLRPDQSVPDASARVRALLEETRGIRRGVLAMAMKQLPLFLVPAPGVDVTTLPQRVQARITWDNNSWYINSVNNQPLFSFDLPETLFDKYATGGVLTRRAALDLKEDMLSRLQATLFDGDTARVVEFELDGDWVNRVRERIENGPERADR